jgi:hypothetical protein
VRGFRSHRFWCCGPDYVTIAYDQIWLSGDADSAPPGIEVGRLPT